MILKIKIKKDKLYNVYNTTDIFHLNDFVQPDQIKYILLAASKFVNEHYVYPYLIKENELHLTVSGGNGEYTVEPIHRPPFHYESVERVIADTACINPKDLFRKTRKKEYCVSRGVLFTAANYFGGISKKRLAKIYAYDRVALAHLINKTVPSYMLSKDRFTVNLVKTVSDYFKDSGFISRCSSFKSAISFTPPKKYIGVRADRNRWQCNIHHGGKCIYLGCYSYPELAAKAYNKYIIDNNLNKKLNTL